MTLSPDEFARLDAKIRQNDLPNQLEGREGPSPLVQEYRAFMEARGEYDPRSDAEITLALGDMLRQEQAMENQFSQNALNIESKDQSFRDDYLDLDLNRMDSGMGAEFMSGLEASGRGLVGTMSGAYGLSGLPGHESAYQWGVDVQTNAPRASVRKVEDLFRANGISFKAASQYLPNAVGQAIPSLVEGVAAFLIGSGTAGVGAVGLYGAKKGVQQGVKGAMRKALRDSLKKKITTKGMKYGPDHKLVKDGIKSADDLMDVEDAAAMLWKTRGGTGASVLNSLALNSGEIYNGLREDGFSHEEAQGSALAYGSLAALPDSALPAWVGRSFLKRAGVIGQSQQAQQNALGWLGKQTKRLKESTPLKLGFGIALEGSTEGFQEYVNIMASAWKRGEDPPLDELQRSRIINASVIGTIAGGLGAVTTLGGKRDRETTPSTTDQNLPRDSTPYSDTAPTDYPSGSIVTFTGNSGTPQVGRVVRTTAEGTQVEPILAFDEPTDGPATIKKVGSPVVIPTSSITGLPTATDFSRIQSLATEGATEVAQEAIREMGEEEASREQLETERDILQDDLAQGVGDETTDARLAELDAILESYPDAEATIVGSDSEPVSGSDQADLGGSREITFSDQGIKLKPIVVDGVSYNVATSFGRAKVLVDVNGVLVPFYLTSGKGGKGLKDGWYPFFGIGKDGWMNKTGKSDMETYYERYWGADTAALVKSIAGELNSFYGTDPKAFADGKTTAAKPISDFADKAEDYINQQLSITPALNGTEENGGVNPRTQIRQNAEKLSNDILANRKNQPVAESDQVDLAPTPLDERISELEEIHKQGETKPQAMIREKVKEGGPEKYYKFLKQRHKNVDVNAPLDKQVAIHKAQDALANKNSTQAERVHARLVLSGTEKVWNGAAISDTQRRINDYISGENKNYYKLEDQKLAWNEAMKAEVDGKGEATTDKKPTPNYKEYATEFDKKYKIPKTSKKLSAYRDKKKEDLKKLKERLAKLVNLKSPKAKKLKDQIKEKQGLISEVSDRLKDAINAEAGVSETTNEVLQEALGEDEGGEGEGGEGGEGGEEAEPIVKTSPPKVKVDARLVAKSEEDYRDAQEQVRLAQAELDAAKENRTLTFTGKKDEGATQSNDILKLKLNLKFKRIKEREAYNALLKAKGVDRSDPMAMAEEIGLIDPNEPASNPETPAIRKEAKKDKEKKTTSAKRDGAKRKGGKYQRRSPSGQIDEYSVTEVDEITRLRNFKTSEGSDYNAIRQSVVKSILEETNSFNSGFITPQQLYDKIKVAFAEAIQDYKTERWVLEAADDIILDIRKKIGDGSDSQKYRVRILEIHNNVRREPIDVQYETLDDSPITRPYEYYYPTQQKTDVDDEGKVRGGKAVRVSKSFDATNPVSAALAVKTKLGAERFNQHTNWDQLSDPLTGGGEISTLGVLFQSARSKDTLKKYYYEIRKGGGRVSNPKAFTVEEDGVRKPIAFLVLRDGKRIIVTDHTGRRVRIVHPDGVVVPDPDSIRVPSQDAAIQVYRTKKGGNPQWAVVDKSVNVAGMSEAEIETLLKKRTHGGNQTTTNLGDKSGSRYRTRGAIILETPNGETVMSGLADFTTENRVEKYPHAGHLGVLQFLNIQGGGRVIQQGKNNVPAPLQDMIDAGYKPRLVLRLGKFVKGKDRKIDSLSGYIEQRRWKNYSEFEGWLENVGTERGGTRQQALGGAEAAQQEAKDKVIQAFPKIVQKVMASGLNTTSLDKLLELVSKEFDPKSPAELADLFKAGDPELVKAKINGVIEPRLPSDWLEWDDIFIALQQTDRGVVEHLQKVAEASIAQRNQDIADQTPIQSDEVFPEVEEVKRVKPTEEDFKRAEAELRSESVWMPNPLPRDERGDYGVVDRARQIAEARELPNKKRISDANHEIARGNKLDRQFNQVLEALNKSGIDVKIFRKEMGSVYDFLHANNADFNDIDGVVRLVVNDILRPDGTNLLSLFHESTHFVLDNLPTNQRRSMLEAILSAEKEFGQAKLGDRLGRLSKMVKDGIITQKDYDEQTSAEELLVEAVARNLKEGAGVQKGTIRAMIRKVREVFYRILSAIARAAGIEGMLAADLAEKYLTAKVEQFVGMDHQVLPDFVTFIKGPDYTPGEVASTFKVRDSERIVDLFDPVTGEIKNSEVSPSSPMAMEINKQNAISTRTAVSNYIQTRKGTNDRLWSAFTKQYGGEVSLSAITEFAENDTLSNGFNDMTKVGLTEPRVQIVPNNHPLLDGGKPAVYVYSRSTPPTILLARDFGYSSAQPTNETQLSAYLEMQKNVLAEVVGHELTHHVATSVFQDAKKAGRLGVTRFAKLARQTVADWTELFKAARKAAGRKADMMYGFTSVEEFVSETRNNPKFQRYLKRIELPDNLSKRFGFKTGGRIWDAFNLALGRTIQPSSSLYQASAALMKRTLEAGAAGVVARKNFSPIKYLLNDKTLTPQERIFFTMPDQALHSILARVPTLKTNKALHEALAIKITQDDFIETTEEPIEYNGETLMPHTRYLLARPRTQQEPNPPLSRAVNPMTTSMHGTGRRPADEDMWRIMRTDSFIKWFGDWQNNPNIGDGTVAFHRHQDTGEPNVYFTGRAGKAEQRERVSGLASQTIDSAYMHPAPQSRVQVIGKTTDVAGGTLDANQQASDFDFDRQSPPQASKSADKDIGDAKGGSAIGGAGGEDTAYTTYSGLSPRNAADWHDGFKMSNSSPNALPLIRDRYLKAYFDNLSYTGSGSTPTELIDQEMGLFHSSAYGSSVVGGDVSGGNWSPVYLTAFGYTEQSKKGDQLYPVPAGLVQSFVGGSDASLSADSKNLITSDKLTDSDFGEGSRYGVPGELKDKVVGRIFFIPGNVGATSSDYDSSQYSNATAYNRDHIHGMIAIEKADGTTEYFRLTKSINDPALDATAELDKLTTSKGFEKLTNGGWTYDTAVDSLEATTMRVGETGLDILGGGMMEMPDNYKTVTLKGSINLDKLGDYVEKVSPQDFSAHARRMSKEMGKVLGENTKKLEATMTGNVLQVKLMNLYTKEYGEESSDIVEARRQGKLPPSKKTWRDMTWEQAAEVLNVPLQELFSVNGLEFGVDRAEWRRVSDKDKARVANEARSAGQEITISDDKISRTLPSGEINVYMPFDPAENRFDAMQQGLTVPVFSGARKPFMYNEEGSQAQMYASVSDTWVETMRHMMAARLPRYHQRSNYQDRYENGSVDPGVFYDDIHDLSKSWELSNARRYSKFLGDEYSTYRNPITSLSSSIERSEVFDKESGTNIATVEASDLDALLKGEAIAGGLGDMKNISEAELKEVESDFNEISAGDEVHSYGYDLPSGKSALEPLLYYRRQYESDRDEDMYLSDRAESAVVSFMFNKGYSQADIASIVAAIKFGQEVERLSVEGDERSDYRPFGEDGISREPAVNQLQAFKYTLRQSAELAGIPHVRLLGLIAMNSKLGVLQRNQNWRGNIKSFGNMYSTDKQFLYEARRLDEKVPVTVNKDSTPAIDHGDVIVEDGKLYRIEKLNKKEAREQVYGSIVLNLAGILNPPKTLIKITTGEDAFIDGGVYSTDSIESGVEYAVATPIGLTPMVDGMAANTMAWSGGARLTGISPDETNTKSIRIFSRSNRNIDYGSLTPLHTSMYIGDTKLKLGEGKVNRGDMGGEETMESTQAGGVLLHGIPDEFFIHAARDAGYKFSTDSVAEGESAESYGLAIDPLYSSDQDDLTVISSETIEEDIRDIDLVKLPESLAGGSATLQQWQGKEGQTLFSNGIWESDTLLRKRNSSPSPKRIYGEAIGSNVSNYITGGLVAAAKVTEQNKLEQFKVKGMTELKNDPSLSRHVSKLSDQDLDPSILMEKQKVLDLIVHAVGDYIVNNRDGHAGNFGISPEGRIVSFDKGQAMRFYQANAFPSSRMAERNEDDIRYTMDTTPENVYNEGGDSKGIIHFLNHQYGEAADMGNPRVIYSMLRDLASANLKDGRLTTDDILNALAPVIERAGKLSDKLSDGDFADSLFSDYSADESHGEGLSEVTPEVYQDAIAQEMASRASDMEAKVSELITYLTGESLRSDQSYTDYNNNVVGSPESISIKDDRFQGDVRSLINKKKDLVRTSISPYYMNRLMDGFERQSEEYQSDKMADSGQEQDEFATSLMMLGSRSRISSMNPTLDYDFIIDPMTQDTTVGSQVLFPFAGHPERGLKHVYNEGSFGQDESNPFAFKRRIDDMDSSSEMSDTAARGNAYDSTQAASNRMLLESIQEAHVEAIQSGFKGNLEEYIKKYFKINPQENIAAIAERDQDVADSSITQFDGNSAMTDRTLRFAAALHSDTMRNLTNEKRKLEDKLEQTDDEIQQTAEEMNDLSTKWRDSSIHEKNAQAQIRRLIKEYVRGMDGQIDMTFAHGQLLGSIQEVEQVIKGESLSSVYRDALYNIFDGNVKVFDYLQGMAELGIDYSKSTEQEILSAIKSSDKPILKDLQRSKPLMATLIAFSKEKALQMALLEARTTRDVTEAGNIDNEIKKTQRLSEEQLKELRAEIGGIRKSVSKVYKVRDAYAEARLKHKRKLAQADRDRERIKFYGNAIKIISEQESELQARLGAGYNFTAVPGQEYFIMQKIGNDWVATKAIYSVEGTDANRSKVNNAKYWNKAYINEQVAKGKGDEPFVKMLAEMNAQLSKAVIHREYRAIHLNMLDRKLGTLEQRLRALGQSGVQVSRMVAEFRRIQSNYRNEEVTLSGRWEGAYGNAIKASGMDQDVFKDMVYDTGIYWIENMPEYADDPTALYSAVFKQIEKVYKAQGKNVNPELKPALEKLWAATERIAEFENKIADDNNVLVEDPSVQWSNPLTGKRENILRRRIKYGRMTIPRRLRGEVIATITKLMRDSGWDNSTIFADIKLLSKTAIGEDDAYNQMMGLAGQLFSNPTTINTFLDPLLSKPGDPIFTAPRKKGSKAKHPIAQAEVASAWVNSGKNFPEFVKELFLNLDGDPQDLPSFTAGIIGRLREVYNMTRMIANKVDNDPLDPNSHTPHRMMDARTNTIFPREWLEYDTYTKVDAGIHISKLASVAAFGRDSRVLSGMLTAAKAEARLLALPLGEIRQDPAYLALGTEKERRKFLEARLGNDFESASKAGRIIDEVDDLAKDMMDLFAAPGGGFKDMRSLEELAQLNSDLVLRTPKSGLWQGLSGMDYTQRLGFGTLAGKASGSFIYNSIKNIFGSIFNEGLGIPLLQASESAKTINYIRSTPGQQDLTFQELFANHGVRGPGESLIKMSRVARSALDKSIGLKGGAAGSSGFAPFTPLSPFSWLNNVFGSAVAEGGVTVWRTVITRALEYIDANPSVLSDPNFRFNLKHLGISGSILGGNERALEYLADAWAEHTGESLLDFIKRSYNRKQNRQEIFNEEDYLKMYQITMDDINLEGGIGSTPISFRTNGILRVATPLLRWATAKTNAVNQSLKTQEGRYTVNSVLKGLAGISAVSMPIGIAATMLMDEYDEEILGKKSNLREVDPQNLLPGFAAYNMLTNKDGQGLAILERLARSGNVYGLGMEAIYGMAAWTDPQQGQRALGIDRILVYSQVANFRDAFLNMMHSGWYMNYEDGKKIMDVMLGQGPAHFTQTFNNLVMPINDNEVRRVKRVDAYNYLRSAGRSAGVPLKKSGIRTNPTPLTARIRQMQLAAYGDDPEEFNAILQDAIQAAVDMGKEDPIGSIVASWKAREPMDLFQRTLTDDETALVFSHMNERGRANVLDLIRLHEKYLNYLAPRKQVKISNDRGTVNDYSRERIRYNRLEYLDL